MYNIKFTILSISINKYISVVLNAFMKSCNRHHCMFSELFIIPNKNSKPMKQQLPSSHFFQYLVNSLLLFVSMNVPILSTSLKQNPYTICPLVLACFYLA